MRGQWLTVAPTVLFIRNEHLATEAMLGEAFTECGFDVQTFEVVPAEHVDEPDIEVAFPDPTDYDVIVAASTEYGTGDFSAPFTFHTLRPLSQPPSALRK